MASKIKLSTEMNSKYFKVTKSDNEKPKMMVGYSLEQIPHFQGEFKQYTDFYWPLIAIYT